MRTLMKFLREASDECLDQVLVLFGEMLAAEKEMFSFFKEEGGLKDVCRATKRSNSPAVIGLVKLFGTDCKEVCRSSLLGVVHRYCTRGRIHKYNNMFKLPIRSWCCSILVKLTCSYTTWITGVQGRRIPWIMDNEYPTKMLLYKTDFT